MPIPNNLTDLDSQTVKYDVRNGKKVLKDMIVQDYTKDYGTKNNLTIRKLEMNVDHKDDDSKVQKVKYFVQIYCLL